MTNRFPLVVDTTDNKIKEIPSGDTLSLQDCDLANVSAIYSGSVRAASVNTDSLQIDGEDIAKVAKTGDYNDLAQAPSVFGGSYDDLSDKPHIPNYIGQLNDVEEIDPSDKNILQYDSSKGMFVITTLDIDLNKYQLNQLGDVVITGTNNRKFLKKSGGLWQAASIDYTTDVNNTPDNLSAFINDLGFVSQNNFDTGLTYSPSDSTDWANPAPTTVWDALDRIASALTANGQTP